MNSFPAYSVRPDYDQPVYSASKPSSRQCAPQEVKAFTMGTVIGKSRKFLSSAAVRARAPAPQSDVHFVEVIKPKTVAEEVYEREIETGISLDEATIEVEMEKRARLRDKTQPRLRDFLVFQENRLTEYDSNEVHWQWAMGLHRKARVCCCC